MDTMTHSSDQDMISQDKAAVMKLNQLLLRMRTDFLPGKSSTDTLGGVKNHMNDTACGSINNNNNNDSIPRSKTCDNRLNKAKNSSTKKERKRSLPILTTQVKQDVVEQLDGLLGHLETMGEEQLTAQSQPSPQQPPPDPIEPQYAKVNKQTKTKAKNKNREHTNSLDSSPQKTKRFSSSFSLRRRKRVDAPLVEETIPPVVGVEEPLYSQVEDVTYTTIQDSGKTTAGSRATSCGEESIGEPYQLEDAASYLLNKFVFSRQVSVDSKYFSKNYCDLNLGAGGSVAAEHSTMCRRLRGLEASVGITLKKQLHSFVKAKMSSMNVSGCTYCMYAFYEKHKREADEKAQEIRKTITEQEFIRQTLDAQKKQSAADSKWLENEERFSYVGDSSSPNGSTDDDENRYGWRDNLHQGGSKSDSEQLGCTSVADVKKKKLPPLRLRRSIPLWELLKKERKILPLTDDEKSTLSTPPPTPPPGTQSDEHFIENVDDVFTSLTLNDTNPHNTTPSVCTDEAIPLTKIENTEFLLTQNIDNYDKTDNATNMHEEVEVDETEPFLATPSEKYEVMHEGKANETIIDGNKNDISAEEPITNGGNELDTNSLTGELNESTIETNFRASQMLPKDSYDANISVVYRHTADVVKSVLQLNTGMQHAKPEGFVDLVNVVGFNLRDLLARVEDDAKGVCSSGQKEVEMAHRVLSADMAELVNKMKIAQKYADTMLDTQSRRDMLHAAHVLAIDTRNLYDTYVRMCTAATASDTDVSGTG